jgi:hypothetical protein
VLKLHTSDGRTVRIDLQDERQASEWLRRLARPDFQASVTGVSLVEKHDARARCPECGSKCGCSLGVQYSVTRPQDFSRVYFHVEKVEPRGKVRGGERVVVFVDDVRLTVMAHGSQPSARVVLSKIGRQRFNPFAKG